MGTLTCQSSPIPVGKVRIGSKFLGAKKNGDIIIDVCTRFSYPNLYNSDCPTTDPLSPSQPIVVLATSEKLMNACCDLYKINNQDLEFHMQLVLKNYDPSACKQCHEECTNTSDETLDFVDSKSDQTMRGNEKTSLNEEQNQNQPYLFACCENDDNKDLIATSFQVNESENQDFDPLDFNRKIEPVDQGFTSDGVEDLACSIVLPHDEIVQKIDSEVKPEVADDNTVETGQNLNVKIPSVLSNLNGEMYGFEDKIVEKVKYQTSKAFNRLKYKKAKTRCAFCNLDVNHFPRHLIRMHGDEREVLAFSGLPKESRKRSILIGIIRKRGNFNKISDNIISPVRRPRDGKAGLSFVACPYCKGIYNAQYIRRHFTRCHLKDVGEKS